MHQPLFQLSSSQVTLELWSLFDPGDPASLRCFGVLEGRLAGRILVNDATHPAWGIVQEAAHGTIYRGGALDATRWHHVVTTLRHDSDVLVGLWSDDPLLMLLPPHPDYRGGVLEFADRPGSGAGLAVLQQLPADCVLRRIDCGLLERCHWRDDTLAAFGGVEQFLERGVGQCLLRGDAILCEAYAGPAVQGVMEVGVLTHEAYRGRGYATVTCAALIGQCETLGYQTYWNCATSNLASAALARKLGYRVERAYTLVAWFATKAE